MKTTIMIEKIKHNKPLAIAGGLLVVALVVVGLVMLGSDKNKNEEDSFTYKSGSWTADIPQPDLSKTELKELPVADVGKRIDMKRPSFSSPTNISNPLFPIKDGNQTILLGNDDGQPLQVTYTTLPPSQNKTIEWDGKKIETRAVQYVAHFDQRLVEYALDWYAQADDGSVWYFGEDVFNYDGGEVSDMNGTWLAGRDGPATMIMPANPQPGNVYRVENHPGKAFEEVEVKQVNATVDGPLGKVSGCMIASQLHDNDSYSDKIFCPNYGEFFTSKDLDLEVLAIDSSADSLSGGLPANVSSISSEALAIYSAAESGDWKSAETKFEAIKVSWNNLRGSSQVPSQLAAQMDRALRHLEGDILEPGLARQHAIGTQNGAIDVALAGFDIELRHRPASEVDKDRLAVYARKMLIDANALEHGFILSDTRTLELIRDRLSHTLDKAKAKQLEATIKDLRVVADAEDYEKVTDIANQLLVQFKR